MINLLLERQSNIKTSRPYILFTHSLKHEQHVTEETAALVHSAACESSEPGHCRYMY